MTLYILRGAFLLLAAAVASLYLLSSQEGVGVGFFEAAVMLIAAVLVAAAVIAGDMARPKKRLSSVSGIFLGLVAGLVAAYALSFVVDLIGLLTAPELGEGRDAYFNLLEGVKVLIGLITCYIGITLVLQTKDDFRFVIPYVEFAKEIRGNRPTILDTSVIVDGRILDIIETRVLQGSIIIPKFVLDELQTIADAGDKLKRARGRRGLDVLQKLQGGHMVDVHVDDREVEGVGVDQKLISLAHATQARVMTNDYNLNKIATLRGVDVVNLNDLAKAMRPVVLPGEHLGVKLVKPGESPSQGVGYLEDGTMIVVEDGRDHIGEEIELVVTSTLQTSAGRMIFGRFERGGDSAAGSSAAGESAVRPGLDAEPESPSDASAVGAAAASSTPPTPARRTSRASRRNPRRS